jgi:hypothetical protein
MEKGIERGADGGGNKMGEVRKNRKGRYEE